MKDDLPINIKRVIDLTNKKFGRWTVIKMVGRNKQGKIMWLCQCSCGTNREVVGGDLKNGKSTSCGCLRIESITTHSLYGTPTYKTWADMTQRCNNVNHYNYSDYGGRGIKVCKRWLKFENFFADMGIKPEGLTIERIDNNKGYYKENCCWASMLDQSKNKRMQKNNKTGTTGVCWEKRRKKYLVNIFANHKNHYIGYFDTLKQAAKAREVAELKYWR